MVNLYRVINNEVDRADRVDFGGVSSQGLDGISHGSKVNNGWDTATKVFLI